MSVAKSSALAFLGNCDSPNLPIVTLNIPAQYQFCVDAGASSALAFFDDSATVGMHDHIAYSMQAFMGSVHAVLARAGKGAPSTAQACIDAFAAGYLGRIQQELRLFHSGGREREFSRAAFDDPSCSNKIH